MEARRHILAILGVQSTQSYDKYLGLSAIKGKSRIRTFKSIKDRIWSRISNWKMKILLQAGKEILLKAVVQAILTCSMSVFKLPKALCRDLNSMMHKLWWGQQEQESKIHRMNWSKMWTQNVGGIGVS
jgi:hypothetical protein